MQGMGPGFKVVLCYPLSASRRRAVPYGAWDAGGGLPYLDGALGKQSVHCVVLLRPIKLLNSISILWEDTPGVNLRCVRETEKAGQRLTGLNNLRAAELNTLTVT